MTRGETQAELALLCRVGALTCAFPVETVAETLRPLPIAPLANTPAFVLGTVVLRGVPVPVVDGPALLGCPAGPRGKFVALKVDERRVVFTVEAVLGVQPLPPSVFRDLPPLLQGGGHGVVAALGSLDAALLARIQSARLVPAGVWTELEARGASR